jgi:hypothetical protein
MQAARPKAGSSNHSADDLPRRASERERETGRTEGTSM